MKKSGKSKWEKSWQIQSVHSKLEAYCSAYLIGY